MERSRNSFTDESVLTDYFESMTFAQRLSEIMEVRGVNKTQLAKAMGVSSQAAGQWALGGHGPVVAKLWPMAEFLGVTVPELVAEPGSPISGTDLLPHRQTAIKFPQKPEEFTLVSAWGKMPEDMQVVLVKIALVLTPDITADAA